MASVRRSARRVAQGVLWGLTAVHVAEAVMLRKRRNLLTAARRRPVTWRPRST